MKKRAWLVLLFVFSAPAFAHIRVDFLELSLANAQYILNARLNIQWNERIKESLHHGIELVFVADVKIQEKRWKIWQTELLHAQKKWRVFFNPITREYRLSLGGLYQSFSSFDELEQALAHMNNWIIAQAKDVSLNENCTLAFRFYLDVSELPQTFQIGIWGNQEWRLDSGWIFQKNLALTAENQT